MLEKINTAANYIKDQYSKPIDCAVVLGSGLGDLTKKINIQIEIPYSEIPHFHSPNVVGHVGKLIIGTLGNKTIAALAGRVHLYEGHHIDDVVFAVRTLSRLGIKKLILSNAAGGINTDYNPGDIVLISDHINLTGQNPLIGKNIDELGVRFPDMSDAYSKSTQETILEKLKSNGINLHTGVYAGLMGPSYETPAEIKMLRTMGADLVGMSTVCEAIAASHLGMSTIAFSCVTNMAAGILNEKLSHDDVKDVANKAMQNFCTIVENTIEVI